jgi:hypothetical protein
METPIAAKTTPKISCKRTRESKTTNHVLCDVLKVLEKYPTNKDQQANGLLLAVCEKLDPKHLFIEPSSNHSNKFIVQCQITIARLQDYCVMATRNMKNHEITLISERKITISYNSTTTTSCLDGKEEEDGDEDEMSNKKICRRDPDYKVLKSDIIELEKKVQEENDLYRRSLNFANEAKEALNAARTEIQTQLGPMPAPSDINDLMKWCDQLKEKSKVYQSKYDGNGSGNNLSAMSYVTQRRSALAESLGELEQKYGHVKNVAASWEHQHLNISQMRRECDIFIDIPAN